MRIAERPAVGRGGFLALLALVFVLAWATPADALEVREGEAVVVSRGETIADDVYAFGATIEVHGTIEGDLVAFGSSVVIEGVVEGNVIAGCSTLSVPGEVGGTVRVGAATVDVVGSIGRDLLAGAGLVRIGSGGEVDGDVVVGAGQFTASGSIGDDLDVGAGSVRIGGSVGGDVTAETDSLAVADTADVGGDLVYYSARTADVPEDVVGGEVERRSPRIDREKAEETRPSFLATAMFAVWAWVRSFIGMALFGLVFVVLFPGFGVRAAGLIREKVLPSLGVGIGVLILTPMLALFVMIVGFLTGGWWLSLVIGALYWIALLCGVVVGALFVGRWVLEGFGRKDSRPLWTMLAGLLIVWIVGAVPVIGQLATLAVVVLGLGATAVSLARLRAEADAAA